MTQNAPEFVCDLTVFSPSQRQAHIRNAQDVVLEAVTEEIPQGFVFRYTDRPGLVEKLAAYVEGERRCCPFFGFELRVEAGGKGVSLTLVAPPEGKQILRTGLQLLRDGARGEEAQRLFSEKTGARVGA